MSTGLLSPINESLAYVFCPNCRANGTPNSMLTRSMYIFKCQFGHQFEWAQLQRMQPDMTPMSEILRETPNPLAIKWAVFVMPKVKEALEVKFAGRLMTTLGTFFDALVDDALIIVQGSEAAELKKRGIHNGASIIASLNSYAQLEKDRTEAVAKLERLTQILRSVGVEE